MASLPVKALALKLKAKSSKLSKPTVRKPRNRTHPPAAVMVNEAISTLKDRKGSSLQAIKKYIEAKFSLNILKQSFYIKQYLKTAVANKTIEQTTGTGASGRFKLFKDASKPKVVVKKPAAKKTTEAAKKSVATKSKSAAKPKDGAAKKRKSSTARRRSKVRVA